MNSTFGPVVFSSNCESLFTRTFIRLIYLKKSLIDVTGWKYNVQSGLSVFVPCLSFVGARTQLFSNST